MTHDTHAKFISFNATMFNGFVCRSWSCIAEKTQYAGHPHGVTLSRLRRHFKTSILQPCNLLVLEAGRKRTLDTLFGRREKYFLPKLLLPSLLSAQWRIDPASPMSLIVEPGMRPTFNALARSLLPSPFCPLCWITPSL